jgi:hypothetical protein
MITFDEALPAITRILGENKTHIDNLKWLVINRDLNGKIRLLMDKEIEEGFDIGDESYSWIEEIAHAIEPHSYPAGDMVLFESSRERALQQKPHFSLPGIEGVTVVDRLLAESDWTGIVPESAGVPRMVFFSIKGGVGRSTALAAASWALAEEGKKVLVLDLDLESPGISSLLLPPERYPVYGILDWITEDLVDNGGVVFEYMTALSAISNSGEIHVIPAHGKETGEYISKLGRAWMPKPDIAGGREPWYKRLDRLIQKLEHAWEPDVILIDSRAGIDEVSAACVSCLGAKNVFLFGLDSEQTWVGYDILFRHWNRSGASRHIRDRLQMIGAMIQKDSEPGYVAGLTERSYTIFSDELYDPVRPGEPIGDAFNFDIDDDEAPHFPLLIYWNRAIAGLPNLYSCFNRAGIREQIKIDFGQFINRITNYV